MTDKKCGTCKSFMLDPSRPYSGACNRYDASTRSGWFENGLDSDRYFRVRADGEPMTDLCWHERTESLDQPEIVRCRDCWNFNDDYEPAECRMTGLDVAGYDFCSQGERREP